MKPMKTTLAMVFLTCSAVATAAETAPLTVIGTINPAACEVSLSTATVDLGTIPYADIAQTGTYGYSTDGKPLTLTVTCPTAQMTALAATDNAASTSTNPANFGYGLGMAEGQKIGYYTLKVYNDAGVTVDGQPGTPLSGSSPGHYAIDNADGYASLNTEFGLAATAGTTSPADFHPTPAKQVVYPVTLSAYISNKDALTLTSDATIAGSATISLVYL